MLRSTPIANETEFQEWLLLVLQAERMRLQEQTAALDSRVGYPGEPKHDGQSEGKNGSTREK